MKTVFLSCAKNYRNALKYVFTVMGMLFLTVLLAGSAFYVKTAAAVVQLKADVIANYEEADLKLTYLVDAVEQRIEEFGLGDVIRVLELKSIMPLLEGRIERALNVVIDNYTEFAEALKVSVETFTNSIYIAIVLMVIVLLLGLVISFFTTEFCVRRRLAKTNFFRFLLETLVRLVGTVLAIVIVAKLYEAFPDYLTAILCLLPVLLVLFAMLATWITSLGKGFKFGQIVNIRNFFVLLVADALMLAITLGIGYLVYLVTNIVVAAAVGLALVIVMLAALDLSSVTCVVGLEIEKAKDEKQLETAEEETKVIVEAKPAAEVKSEAAPAAEAKPAVEVKSEAAPEAAPAAEAVSAAEEKSAAEARAVSEENPEAGEQAADDEEPAPEGKTPADIKAAVEKKFAEKTKATEWSES